MAAKTRTIRWRAGAKLLFAAAFAVAAFHLAARVQGMSASASKTAIALPPAPAPAPAEPTAEIPAAAPVEDGFVVRRILDIPGPLRHGDWAWDEEGVPAGPVVITVDLAAQTLSVFRAGFEIGTAVILYGADDKPTPLGAFAIREKDADHISNLYDAPMPYMLRLTDDGVAIHGSDVEWGAATHGCIGVPTKFAARLFATVRPGDRVIITNGKMLDPGERLPAA